MVFNIINLLFDLIDGIKIIVIILDEIGIEIVVEIVIIKVVNGDMVGIF